MGCDAYADDDGILWINIYSYETGERLDEVKLSNLIPNEKITVEYERGWER